LFSLLVVPDLQAFIRVPDSDYPLPLGSWRPAAGSSQGLGSVQHGINMLKNRIARHYSAKTQTINLLSIISISEPLSGLPGS
jgi:hypothetical protein